MPTNNFGHPYFVRRATVDNQTGYANDDAQQGAATDEVLLGMAIRGILSGPLALSFEGKPEAIGAFAARIVSGAHEEWYGESAVDLP